MARIDPELIRQLEEARADADPVGAVLYLKPTSGEVALASHELETVARKLMERVSQSTGQEPADYNLFRNLGMLAVKGGREFMSELINQPEIQSAIANKVR